MEIYIYIYKVPAKQLLFDSPSDKFLISGCFNFMV